MKPELLNLWKKNLRANRKYFWAVASCGMLLLSIIFFTMALGDCMSVIATGRESDLLRGYATISTFMSTYLLLFALLVINVIGYMKKRYFDYEMFTFLGIKPKHKNLMITYEYLGVLVISVVGGILLGVIESEILRYVLGRVFADSVEKVFYGFTPLGTTVVMGILMFGIGFLVIDFLMIWFGLSGLLGLGRKGGKPIRFKKRGLAIGVLLFVVSIGNLATYLGKSWKIMPLTLGVFGVLFVMKHGVAYFLLKLKKEDSKYYKKLLWLDSWYHQFQHHINLTYVNSAFLIFIVSFFMIGLLDSIPFEEEEHYPYDIVWMANEEDTDFLAQIKEKYDAEIMTYPCIRVTTADEAEQTGISESVYEELTGEELELSGEEIFIVHQRERSERDMLGIDFGSSRPRMYLGKARGDLWLGNAKRAGTELSKRYTSVGMEDRVITGVFKNGNKENIVVFSDEFFEKVRPGIDGADLLVTMNFAGGSRNVQNVGDEREVYQKAVAEIKNYASFYSQIDYFSINQEQNLVFEKNEQLIESREEKLMVFASVSVNILLLLICVVFVFAEKMKSDEDDIIAKNRFCFLSGMTAANRKKTVQREIGFTSILAAGSGLLLSVLFALIQIASKHLPSMHWVMWYVAGIGICVLVLIGIFAIMTFVEVRIIYGKAERANEHE